jgi:hypothetical protein
MKNIKNINSGFGALGLFLVTISVAIAGYGVYQFTVESPVDIGDQVVVDDTGAATEYQTFPFKCTDLFTKDNFLALKYVDQAREVIVDEEPGYSYDDYRHISCTYWQRSKNSPEQPFINVNLSIYDGASGQPSVEEKYQQEKAAEVNLYEITYKKKVDWPELSGIGAKAFKHFTGNEIVALSSSQKYLFRVSGQVNVGEDEIPGIAKIIDANLSKY